MRRTCGDILALTLAAFVLSGGTLWAQDSGDVRYWPLREINFPVPVDRIQAMSPRPAKLRFHAARERGRFELVAEKSLADLEVIDADRNRRGFRYSSPSDGAYEFALQFVYADGDVTPTDAALSAQYKIIFDTRPPLVRLEPAGSSGVQWEVSDENADPEGVVLQVRWQGSNKWSPINPRPLNLRDRYTWQGLSPSQPLEVRIVAKDRAGLEMASRPLVLPNSGTTTSNPITGSFGDPYGVTPSRPQIDYVNNVNLTIASKLTRVTRSGVKAAHLWVNEGKTGWRKFTEESLVQPIDPSTPDPTIRMKYTAPKDGLYGFIVIPVNGAGGKQDDPRANDPAQILVEVDTELPYIKIKSIRVAPGGAVGPRVEIEWDAKDKNPMPEPIVLSYAETPNAPDSAWKLITPSPIADTGRYVWEVEDKNLWHFHVRASYVDKASNRSVDVYEKEVIIDLETPSAIIDRVVGSGRMNGSGNNGSGVARPSTSVKPTTPVAPTPSGGRPSTNPPLTAPPLISPSKASPLK